MRTVEILMRLQKIKAEIALLEAELTEKPAFWQTNREIVYGIDLSLLDATTAGLVRAGHLPTITHLGGRIEDAGQSEDYAG